MILQSLILPGAKPLDVVPMFFRTPDSGLGGNLCGSSLNIPRGSTVSFDTYFNSFSIRKWNKFTNLHRISCKIESEGTFTFQLCNKFLSNGKVIESVLFETNDKKELYCHAILINEYDGICYLRMTADSDDAILHNFTFQTEEVANREVSFALIMCTYKREAYVKKNIELLTAGVINNNASPLKDKFRIIVVDNGNTLPTGSIAKNVFIYPNKNTGGAGGFTRGLMETSNNFPEITHCILMDDDVEVSVPSFQRLQAFLSLLKEEYQNGFVGGAMFLMNSPSIQHEVSAYWEGGQNFLAPIKRKKDMTSVANILENDIEVDQDNKYAAWWFCCLPMEKNICNNLPMPFFIRCDDVEYSLRKTKTIINLNSICVWHEAFYLKAKQYQYNYYRIRNCLAIEAVHFGLRPKIQMLNFVNRLILSELFRYNYKGAGAIFKAIAHFSKGPAFFMNSDPVEIESCVRSFEEDWIEDSSIPLEKVLYSKVENRASRILRIITMNGILIPTIFYRGIAYCNVRGKGDNLNKYFVKNTIIVYDQFKKQKTIRKPSTVKNFVMLIRLAMLNLKILCRLNSIEGKYKKDYKKMITYDFWKSYLELD